LSRQLRLDVAQLTDVGRKRPHNEDNMAYVIPKDEQVLTNKGALFIVADGMGGHAAGEVASEIAVDTVSSAYYQDESNDIDVSLMNAIKRANALIHQRAAENMMRSGMGTTCVAAVLRSEKAYIANVGDSRAYMVRHGQSRQISQDHSWVEEQVRAGLLTKDQARSHAQRNVITRSLGTQSEVEVDVFSETLGVGDTLVLCSDGLSGYITEDDLRTIITQYPPRESVYHLVERANENGGPDNITAIVIRVDELSDDVTDALYPVPAGSRVADETTVLLGSVASSTTGSVMRTTDDPRFSSSSVATSVADPAQANVDATLRSAPTITRPGRKRLLFPTLAIVLLFLLVFAGSGAYFFFHASHTDNSLSTANDLVDQANGEITTNPVGALIQLTQAQSDLHTIQSGTLGGQQLQRFTTLQGKLVSEFKTALTNYNAHAQIAPLPCANAAPVLINTGNASLQAWTVATVTDGKNHTFSYVLGSDKTLYQLAANNSLTKLPSAPADIVLMTNDTQHLYLLTKTTDQNNPYSLFVFTPTANGALTKTGNVNISASLLSGLAPQLMTSSNGTIYVVATSNQTNQNQAKIFSYQAAKITTTPQAATISISSRIVGVAAWPDQRLFLLHSDGEVKSLQFTTTNATENQVVLQNTIETPWSVDPQSVTATTPVPVPSGPITHFLTIPAPSPTTSTQSLLVAAQVNNASHLYIYDAANHRILDVTSFAGGSVGNANNASSLQLVRQYASPTTLSAVEGMTIDPMGNQLNVITQSGNGTFVTKLVTVGVSQQTMCTPAA